MPDYVFINRKSLLYTQVLQKGPLRAGIIPHVTNAIPKLAPRYVMYGALFTGLAASLSFRSLVLLEHIEPAWVRPVWYFAVIGNFFFFYYRFHISEKRKHAITQKRLLEKIEKNEPLTDDDRAVLSYLLNSVKKSPENINYIIISVFSLMAIAGDLVLAYLD